MKDPGLGPRPVGIASAPDHGVTHMSKELSENPTTTDVNDKVEAFFEKYTAALLARDAKALALMYAVPSLIVFPGNRLVVSDPAQGEQFFTSSFAQYDGVDSIEKSISIMAESPSNVWANVAWSYDGQQRERFCYQLVEAEAGYQIAVLSPM